MDIYLHLLQTGVSISIFLYVWSIMILEVSHIIDILVLYFIVIELNIQMQKRGELTNLSSLFLGLKSSKFNVSKMAGY